jgi:hypothetical protein
MKKGRELVSGAKSISSNVHTDWAKRWGTFEGQWLKDLLGKGECTLKKKFKGFPMFLHWKNFKTTFVGDIKQWSSRR